MKNGIIELINFQNTIQANTLALDYLKNIENELIVVTIFGKTSNTISKGLTQTNTNYDNHKQFILFENFLSKQNSHAKFIFIDAKDIQSNSKLFTIMFLISSLYIYCTDSEINDNMIKEFSKILDISKCITANSKIDKDALLTESSPKLLWLFNNISINKSHPETGREFTPKEYIDYNLRKEFKSNISETIIKYFPDRDSLIFKDHQDLMLKINKEVTSKKIKGKKLNGFSLVNIINDFLSYDVPNINQLWDNIIKKDINDFYNQAILTYKESLDSLDKIYEQDEIIKILYEYRLEAMMTLNKIFTLNQDTFNNSEYLSWFNNSKRDLEEEIQKLETKQVDINYNNSTKLCESLLIESYAKIKHNIDIGFYGLINTEQYLKDYENFLNNYAFNSKGPNKLKLLIDFLIQTKATFIKEFLQKAENENKLKIDEFIEAFKASEAKKLEAEEKNQELKNIQSNYEKKVSDLQSDLESKNRQIKNLDETIKKIENEIMLKRNQYNTKK